MMSSLSDSCANTREILNKFPAFALLNREPLPFTDSGTNEEGAR